MPKRGLDLVIKLIFVLIIVLVCLLFLKPKYTSFVILTQFNDSTTTATLTFTDGTTENITRYISLNKNMNVSSAYINLSIVNNGWVNWSDGFSHSGATGEGSGRSMDDITTNGSDFWLVEQESSFVYHLNSTGANQTDGFEVGSAGVGAGMSITTNNSDFWINDFNENFVYHFNRTGANQTDGFYVGSAGVNSSQAITTNGSDFWLTDYYDDFVYHFNRTGANQTDGFEIGSAGVNLGLGITTNNSDFWILDSADNFVYHFNSAGANQTDGFELGSAGINVLGGGGTGITTNVSLTGGIPYDFWIIDQGGQFVYHLRLSYSLNSFLDIGNDSIHEWNHTGNFTLSNNKTANFASAINDYLSSCTADSSGNCTVPFVFHSDTTGEIQYSGIRIDYADIANPTVSLTPSTNTVLNLGGAVSLSCTGTDNVGVSTTVITVAGESFCSGTSSCSGTYTMATSDSKTVTCTVTDTSGNTASQSITLSTGGTGGGGGGGGGGAAAPTVEEVEEEVPILEQPIEQQISEETAIEIPALDYETITIPPAEISASVEGNNIIVNLGNIADIIYSFVDVSGVKKPKIDILFKQENLREIKGLVVIKYFDWLRYVIMGLSILILVLMMSYSYINFKKFYQ